MCITGTAAGYEAYLSCQPTPIHVGTPLICSLKSDFPIDTIFDLEIYGIYNYTTTESHMTLLQRHSLRIWDNTGTARATIDTSNLHGGDYLVNIKYSGTGETPQFSSDSVTSQVIKIIGSSSETPISPQIPTTIQTTGITIIPTSTPTARYTTNLATVPITTIKTPTSEPTTTINYSATIDEMQKQIAEQNAKIAEQGNVLDQIVNFLRNVFGWK